MQLILSDYRCILDDNEVLYQYNISGFKCQTSATGILQDKYAILGMLQNYEFES